MSDSPSQHKKEMVNLCPLVPLSIDDPWTQPNHRLIHLSKKKKGNISQTDRVTNKPGPAQVTPV